ncbi:MAG: FIST C-terminal domain-containing protein [Planctomycetes bacterium]|nr:FIST C-terminal domain-containing protein [Planctomycetota bacterium]
MGSDAMSSAPGRGPAETARFAAAISTDGEAERAETQVVEAALAAMDGRRPDLACVFVSHHYGSALEKLGPRLAEAVGARVLVGTSGETVIGGGREVEQGPALSLWVGHLPDTELRPFESQLEMRTDGTGQFVGAPDVRSSERAGIVMFADPYSFAADEYLASLDRRHAGVPIVGGMCSGGMGPGQNLLFTERGLSTHGAAGVVIEGAVEIRSVVSQGCRPVGKPWVVTGCEANVLRTLAARPAVEVLFETLGALPEEDRALFQRQPFVGLAIDAAKENFERGDFLVRGIVGIEPQDKSFAVGDTLRRGQTIQFLVRDADSASEDLTQLLRTRGTRAPQAPPGSRGALLFSCNGRGTNMFNRPDHDVGCVRATLDTALPVAGFFANGEFGPVGRRNFLHGFTASVALFAPRGSPW